jgi:hypothetical protein
MHRAALALLGLLLLAPLAPMAHSSDSIPQVPCSDPRGCPDLVVDTSRMAVGTQRQEHFSSASCDVVEGMIQAGDREVLRFTYTTPNIGHGDLIVGDPSQHPEWFYYSPCHQHYHFRLYAEYRLWTPDGFVAWNNLRQLNPDEPADQVLAEHPELLGQFVAGHKAGFCVIDVTLGVSLPNGVPAIPDATPKYGDCAHNQGISKGWADEYTWTLAGQYIDVTNVPAGPYILEAEVNAHRLYTEESYGNNRGWIPAVVQHEA